jgi:phospholipid/cholesterol/gamma-HCH transport system substrate-binding protein
VMKRPGSRILAVALALLVLVGGVLALGTPWGSDQRRVTAMFPSTVNLYKGANVKVLGVQVGKVTSVKVVGTSVRVQMTYSGVDLPKDVHALIVPPSIVGDRFVQLAPAYKSGTTLADGATIGRSRTEVPLELDETYRELDGLATALGPQGANKKGALSRLVQASAGTLKGNGRQFQKSLGDLADALDTLSAVDGNYQHTVDQTGQLTRTLQANDKTVRRLVLSLARVTATLNAQRQDIHQASTGLSSALDDVAKFTKNNRGRLKGTIAGLRDVSTTLNRRIDDLDDLLTLAPVGFVDAMNINVPTNYDPTAKGSTRLKGRTTSFAQRGVFTTNLGVQLSSAITGVCENAGSSQAAQLAPLCTALAAAGNDLGLLLSEVATNGGLPNSKGSAKTPKLTGAEFLARLRTLAAQSRGGR